MTHPQICLMNNVSVNDHFFSHSIFALRIQVKVSDRPRELANGTHAKPDARPGRESSDADVSAECSTSYREAEDISRADFKAVGTGFQVGSAPGWMPHAAKVAQMAV